MNDRELEKLIKEVEGMTGTELADWIKRQRETMITAKDLAIRPCNVAVNGTCPVCGERTDPACGPELFVRGTFDAVCHECGERLNPALMRNLNRLAALANDYYLGKCDLATLAQLPQLGG